MNRISDLQRAALEGVGCARIYEDHGISGRATQRPGLSEALAEMSEGDVLVVWKLDRLGRSLSHLVSMLDDLGKREIGFPRSQKRSDEARRGTFLLDHHVDEGRSRR